MKPTHYVAWIDHHGNEQTLTGDMQACGLAHDALKGFYKSRCRSGQLINGKIPEHTASRRLVK